MIKCASLADGSSPSDTASGFHPVHLAKPERLDADVTFYLDFCCYAARSSCDEWERAVLKGQKGSADVWPGCW